MNSLNIISARVSPQSSPAPSRTNSLAHVGFSVSSDTSGRTSSESSGGGNGGSSIVRGDRGPAPDASATQDADDGQRGGVDDSRGGDDGSGSYNETTPLLSSGDMKEATMRMSKWRALPKRIAVALIGSLRWVLSTIVSPGVYLVACLYDAEGRFAPIMQLKRLFGVHQRRAHKLAADYDASSIDEKEEFRLADSSAPHHHPPHRVPKITHTFHSSSSSTSGLSSESESDPEGASLGVGAGGRQGSRRRETLDSEEVSPSRKSIRIKLHGDDTLRQRKGTRKGQTAKPRASSSGSAVGGTEGGAGASGVSEADISAQLKSPTSPIAALTKYPKTPAPPRPLIPRRQPSYINDFSPPDPKNLKTLILDLDETLIHSMSKGGRIGSGHMVEVRLNTTWPGVGGQPILGPQHPILYYVHKRPHCDDFLRRVSASRTEEAPWPMLMTFCFATGLQVVQPRRLHCFCTGVCRPRH